MLKNQEYKPLAIPLTTSFDIRAIAFNRSPLIVAESKLARHTVPKKFNVTGDAKNCENAPDAPKNSFFQGPDIALKDLQLEQCVFFALPPSVP